MINYRRFGVLALVAGITAAAVAACGGGNGSTATPQPSATGMQAQFAAYVSCLNKNGVAVTMPTARPSGFPGPRGSGFPGARRSGFPRPFRSGARPSNFPRPSGYPGAGPSGGPGRFGGGFLRRPANVDQATWDKAMAACASVRPSFGPGFGPGFGRRPGDNGAAAAYRNCLHDHGTADGASPSADAVKACAVLKPTAQPS